MTLIQRLGDAALYVVLSLEEFFHVQAAAMPEQMPLPSAIHQGRALLERIHQHRPSTAPVYFQLQDA
jgi:hypothetical protein